MLISVGGGSWVYARMGLVDGIAATNRKEPNHLESSSFGMVSIDRLAKLAPACREKPGSGLSFYLSERKIKGPVLYVVV